MQNNSEHCKFIYTSHMFVYTYSFTSVCGPCHVFSYLAFNMQSPVPPSPHRSTSAVRAYIHFMFSAWRTTAPVRRREHVTRREFSGDGNDFRGQVEHNFCLREFISTFLTTIAIWMPTTHRWFTFYLLTWLILVTHRHGHFQHSAAVLRNLWLHRIRVGRLRSGTRLHFDPLTAKLHTMDMFIVCLNVSW